MVNTKLKTKSKGVTKAKTKSDKPKTKVDSLTKRFSKLTLKDSKGNTPPNSINSLIKRFGELSIKKSGPWIVASQLASMGRDAQLRRTYRYFQDNPSITSGLFAEEYARVQEVSERYEKGRRFRLKDDVILSVAHGNLLQPRRYFTVPPDTYVIFMTYPDNILWTTQDWRNFLNPLYTRKGLDELFEEGKLVNTLALNRGNIHKVQIDVRVPKDLCENLQLGYVDNARYPHLGIYTLPFDNPRRYGGIGDFVLSPGNDDWPGRNYMPMDATKRTLEGLVKFYLGKIIIVSSCRVNI